MPVTHDGISCPLPLDPLWTAIGVACVAGGVWLVTQGIVVAGGLVLLGVLFLVNQTGARRVRVIHNKLLVEDERLIRNILIGPYRRRIHWTEVTSVHVDPKRLRLETTGKPFVTAEGAPEADLVALKARIEAAMAKEKAEAAKG